MWWFYFFNFFPFRLVDWSHQYSYLLFVLAPKWPSLIYTKHKIIQLILLLKSKHSCLLLLSNDVPLWFCIIEATPSVGGGSVIFPPRFLRLETSAKPFVNTAEKLASCKIIFLYPSFSHFICVKPEIHLV